MTLLKQGNLWLPVVLTTTLGGCTMQEGSVTRPMPVEPKPPAAPTAINFRYLPADKTYNYVATTTTNFVGQQGHTSELHFSVKTSRHADRYVEETTIQSALYDGIPRPGITESMIREFKITSTLDPHGAIVSSKSVGVAHLASPDAKDLGTSFTLPSKALKPGDSWVVDHGQYTTNFKFASIEKTGDQRVATFEERAADKAGHKLDTPTIITVDADTGVLLDKVAQPVLPSGSAPDAPLIPVRSEIRLVAS